MIWISATLLWTKKRRDLWIPPWIPPDNWGRRGVEPRRPQLEATKRPEFPSFSPVDIENQSLFGNHQSLFGQHLKKSKKETKIVIEEENNHCHKDTSKQRKKQKPQNAYNHGVQERVPKVIQSTLPFPIVPPYKPKEPTNPTNRRNHKSNSSFRVLVKFATTSLSRNISSQERKSKKQQQQQNPLMGSPTTISTPLRLPPRPITPTSLEVVRRNFEVSASKGFLKHPVLHVEFNPPRNCKECCCCSAMDFLYVYVGLCNVFLLQFVMVVLWFFSQSEVNLSDLGTWTTWVTIIPVILSHYRQGSKGPQQYCGLMKSLFHIKISGKISQNTFLTRQ